MECDHRNSVCDLGHNIGTFVQNIPFRRKWRNRDSVTNLNGNVSEDVHNTRNVL